ncbi:MAG: hypothetical protein AAGL69_13650 [Pseudomonadota bacterium]
MSDSSAFGDLEHEVAERIARSVAEQSVTLAKLQRLADDYETLALMGELPETALPAQFAINDIPGANLLSKGETAQLLARIYRRAIQLAGQNR